MARTNITKQQVGYPWESKHNAALKAKLDDHDTTLDALVLAGSALLVADGITANAAGRLAFQSGVFDLTTATRIFAAASIPASKLVVSSLDGTQVAVTAAGNTVPAIRVAFIITIPDGTTGSVDTTVDASYGKIVITDIHCIKDTSAGAGDGTIQVKNGTTNAITDAMAIGGAAANAVVRAATIVSTYSTVSSAAALRVTRTKSSGTVGCTVMVSGYRVA